jgi:hypothetical protein
MPPCSRCGRDNPGDATLCAGCGSPLAAGPDLGPAAGSPPAPAVIGAPDLARVTLRHAPPRGGLGVLVSWARLGAWIEAHVRRFPCPVCGRELTVQPPADKVKCGR